VSAAHVLPSVFDPSDPEEVLAELLLDAEEARSDVVAFFEFVLRDETAGLPIHVVPHQALIFEFIEAYRNCVLMIPVNHAKTFTLAGYILWKLGQNPMLRAAVVSAAETQAQKPLQMVRQYVEASEELRFVFPRLRRSHRAGEPWTTTDLTVDRPPGIRDPSLVARGADSKSIPGSRWGLCLVDDLSNAENTNTPEQRDKTYRFVTGLLKSRMDPLEGRVVVTCVAWHRDDTTHRLMAPKSDGGAGWPGMVMRASGTIMFRNCPTFDSALIRPNDDLPSDNPDAEYVLVANDVVPESERTLWRTRWPPEALEAERSDMHPVQYAQNYENVCRDDSTALCKQAYIDRALQLARAMGIRTLVSCAEDFFKYNCRDRGFGAFPIFGGVDLAFSQSTAADECAIFIIGVLPDPDGSKMRIRVPLWCESGKWGADELYKKLEDLDARFSHLPYGFENNGAQEGVRKLMVTSDKTLILKEHTTGATKSSIELGVPSIFGEMANGAWAIPNDGRPLDGALKKWVDQCLYYSPSAHTGDLLMASYFSRDLAKRFGAIAKVGTGKRGDARAASILIR
jgi:hypothetical protein